ncbi:hypothetical protein ANANG_G00310870, partial [Anguilla anguilla]
RIQLFSFTISYLISIDSVQKQFFLNALRAPNGLLHVKTAKLEQEAKKQIQIQREGAVSVRPGIFPAKRSWSRGHINDITKHLRMDVSR